MICLRKFRRTVTFTMRLAYSAICTVGLPRSEPDYYSIHSVCVLASQESNDGTSSCGGSCLGDGKTEGGGGGLTLTNRLPITPCKVWRDSRG